MSLVQLPTWLMERTTPTIKELQTPADLERRRVGKKKQKQKQVLVSFKEKDTLTAGCLLKEQKQLDDEVVTI